MDTVFVRDLRVPVVIGIYAWERKIRQTVTVDLDMATDNRIPAASDDIQDALDYKAVSKRVVQLLDSSDYNLVETMAEDIAQLVLNEFSIPWVRVRVAKPLAVRGSREVGVQIERGELE